MPQSNDFLSGVSLPSLRWAQLLDAWISLSGRKHWLEEILKSKSVVFQKILLGIECRHLDRQFNHADTVAFAKVYNSVVPNEDLYPMTHETRRCMKTAMVHYLNDKAALVGLEGRHLLLPLTQKEISALGGNLLSTLSGEAFSLTDIDQRMSLFSEVASLSTANLINIGSVQYVIAIAEAFRSDLVLESGSRLTPSMARQLGNLIFFTSDVDDKEFNELSEQGVLEQLEPVCLLPNQLRHWSGAMSNMLKSQEKVTLERLISLGSSVVLVPPELLVTMGESVLETAAPYIMEAFTYKSIVAANKTFLQHCQAWLEMEEAGSGDAFAERVEAVVDALTKENGKKRVRRSSDGTEETDKLFESIRTHWKYLYHGDLLSTKQKMMATRVFR
jgi:hypothetical protein